MPSENVRYDDEITRKEFRTKKGQEWLWRMVGMGKRIAIVRWKWKWLRWFRIVGIIRSDNGEGTSPEPEFDPTEKEKKKPMALV